MPRPRPRRPRRPASPSEAALKAAQDKVNQGNQFKQQLDNRVNQVKQANQPKDMNFALVSTPIKLRIHPHPFNFTATAPAAPVKQGEKQELPVKLERLYGFAEQVGADVRAAARRARLVGPGSEIEQGPGRRQAGSGSRGQCPARPARLHRPLPRPVQQCPSRNDGHGDGDRRGSEEVGQRGATPGRRAVA